MRCTTAITHQEEIMKCISRACPCRGARVRCSSAIALGRLSRAADHADRALGRGRRHRRHRAHHRHAAREGARPAGQRRQPHRRQRRRRPLGDRVGGAGRLHDRHHHRRDRHDALAGPDRPHRRVVHADRPRQRRSGRRAGRAPIRRTRPSNDLVAAIKANPGKFKASGTGQGGIWHLAIAGMLQDLKVDPATRAVGAVERRRARAAGPRRRRRADRAVLAARGALADRRRQGARASP